MGLALIIGASSGMGREAALQLAKREEVKELWLVARREERLQEVAAYLDKPCKIYPCDMTDRDAVLALCRDVKAEVEGGRQLVWCVVASGLGKIGKLSSENLTDAEAMVDINVMAYTRLLSLLCPLIDGHTLVFSSIAALVSQPYFSCYAATKAYVLHLVRALRVEYPKAHITAVCPNPVETEFFCHTGGEPERIKRIGVEQKDKVVRHAIQRSLRNKTLSVQSLRAKGIWLSSKLFPEPLIHKVEEWMGVYVNDNN